MTWFELVTRACIWYSQFNIQFSYTIYYNQPDNSISGHYTIICTAYLRNAYSCSSDVRNRTDGWKLLFDEAKHYIIDRAERFQGLNDDRTHNNISVSGKTFLAPKRPCLLLLRLAKNRTGDNNLFKLPMDHVRGKRRGMTRYGKRIKANVIK